MVTSSRLAIEVSLQWAVVRGLLGKGIELHGPFNTLEQAQEYSGKNFPDDTREYMQLRKEIIVHGEE